MLAMLDIRPDLPRRGQRGLERPKPTHPPMWRGSTTRERIDGPDFLGRYRLSTWAANRCCNMEQIGPTRVCVMDDFGFLIDVCLEGSIR